MCPTPATWGDQSTKLPCYRYIPQLGGTDRNAAPAPIPTSGTVRRCTTAIRQSASDPAQCIWCGVLRLAEVRSAEEAKSYHYFVGGDPGHPTGTPTGTPASSLTEGRWGRTARGSSQAVSGSEVLDLVGRTGLPPRVVVPWIHTLRGRPAYVHLYGLARVRL